MGVVRHESVYTPRDFSSGFVMIDCVYVAALLTSRVSSLSCSVLAVFAANGTLLSSTRSKFG